MDLNILCSVCKEQNAEAFCPCTSPVTFLCQGCVGGHMIKDRSVPHTARTLNQLSDYEASQLPAPRNEVPRPKQIPQPQRSQEEVKINIVQPRVQPSSITWAPVPDTGSGKFAAVYFNKVELYDFATQQSTRHSLSVDFGDGGSYIELDANTMLCVGGFPPSARVYSLNLSSLQLTPLAGLHVPRCGAGVAKVTAWIYVFGGQGQISCEKYRSGDKQWQALANMHYPRSHFTPCSFNALIYLVSSSEDRVVESFNPSTEVFTVLAVSLPQQLRLNSHSVAFVSNGELFLLTNDMQKARWKIESEREFRVSTTGRNCSSTQPPRVFGQLVFIASSGRMEKFSLQSFSFVK